MKKKLLIILTAMVLSLSIATNIAIAEEQMKVEIPDDAPEDVDVPTTFPKELLFMINDDNKESKSNLPDLTVTNLGRSREGDNYYEVWYRLYNTGEADIDGASFTDKAWIYNSGRWNAIAASEIDHTNFDLDQETYSSYFNWYFYAPTGWHTLSQWTDIDNDLPEIDDDNNYQSRLWYWY